MRYLEITFIVRTDKMLLLFACVSAFLLAPVASQGMVTVGFYGEALCPDCISFINGPLTTAFKEVVVGVF